MPLSQRELNGMRCSMPHEHDADTCQGGPLYFHSACHIQSPTWAVYDRGVLTITCAKCKAIIAEVLVAETAPPPMPGLDESIVPGRRVGPGETDVEGARAYHERRARERGET